MKWRLDNLRPWFPRTLNLLLLLATVGVGWAWWPTAKAATGHLSQSSCFSCHLGGGEVRPATAATLIGRQEDLCASCHPDAIRASHPSGLIPRRAIPRPFKLDWKGELTCSTCHTIHGATPGLMKSTKRGEALCLECHDRNFFERMVDRGASMTTSGHLDARRSTTPTTPTPPPIDTFSLQCMGCHNEMQGSNQVRIESGLLRHFGNPLSHPIGGLYQSFLRTGGYRAPQLLPKEIMLPDGKISCLSCHQGYSEKHGKLVVGNERSALCLHCHDM